jgi:hypothetical protein
VYRSDLVHLTLLWTVFGGAPPTYAVTKAGKAGVAGGPSSPTQQSGFVLDGFPTTDAQAAALEKYLTGLDLNVEEKKKKEKASRIAPPPPPVCRTCSFLATIWFKDIYVF